MHAQARERRARRPQDRRRFAWRRPAYVLRARGFVFNRFGAAAADGAESIRAVLMLLYSYMARTAASSAAWVRVERRRLVCREANFSRASARLMWMRSAYS